MVKTKVVHCKKEPYDIYIGRPSIYGNPYIVGIHGSRQECIHAFKQLILQNRSLLALIPSLCGKTLGCWCKPNACHGDILAELADEKDNI